MTIFLQETFYKQPQPVSDPLSELLLGEFVHQCHAFDLTPLQQSGSWRNIHIARELSKLLIDEKGELERDLLFKAIQLLEKGLYSLGPNRHHDAKRQQHLLRILRLFYEQKEYGTQLKRISKPETPSRAEQLIRETLFLPENTRLTNADARRAILAALLTRLHQNVGSCFATAPAILIQQDQPLRFLIDIGQLLAIGGLKRTYEGVEYSVPLSASWGAGDLLRPFYLASLGRYPLKALALSPGLQTAFEAARLLDVKITESQKRKSCEKLLKIPTLKKIAENPFATLTADQILKEVLLNHYHITKEDLAQYQSRPLLGMMAPVMQEGKSLLCSRYLKGYEQAKNAFKALTDNALLKAWEFTLASLAETKASATKWNLYASLGVEPEEPHGIGESLHAKIKDRINQFNEEIEAHQSRYDHTFAQVKYLEGRLQRASTENELNWLRTDYQLHRHEINRALNERDTAYEKGNKLTQLFPWLISAYIEKIPEYFQEIYDAEMHDVSANPYDDSPAGFRLLYKHGRPNAALWTMIYTPSEYIQDLTTFFVTTETELSQRSELEGLENEFVELVSTIIATIKHPEFLENSIYRLAKAYKEPIMHNPLANIEQVRRKPWVYISGGSMETLVTCYYGRAQKPKETKQWVESENELLAFLIDAIKGLPFNVQQFYRDNPERSMLAFSPTHAFLLKPGWKLFREGWDSDTYTYTWIRDQWAVEHRQFLKKTVLNSQMMSYLIDQLLHVIPPGYRPVIKKALDRFPFSLTPPEFREQVINTLAYERWIKEERWLTIIAEELDSLLYGSLPLFPEHQLREKLEILFDGHEGRIGAQKENLFKFFDEVEASVGRYKILSAKELRNIAKGLLILASGETRSSIPYHDNIMSVMQQKGLAYPQSILVADTNWINSVFGFTINPGTCGIEFWRFDESGSEGRPMSVWKSYFNGSDRREWGCYISPQEYGQ